MASGVMRPPDESGALDVELRIDDFEVDLRAGRAEIGNWLTATVTIRRIDETSFEFIAEGDRLIFTPEDPDTFGGHPAVDDPTAMKRRQRRRVEKDAKKQAKEEAKEAALDAKEAAKEAERRAKQEAKDAKRSSRRASGRKQGSGQSAPAVDDFRIDVPPVTSLADRTAALKAETARIGPDTEPPSRLESAVESEPIPDPGPAPVEPAAVVDEPEDVAAEPAESRRRIGRRRKHVAEESEAMPEPGLAPEPEPVRVFEPAVITDDDDATGNGETPPDEARRRMRLRRRRDEEDGEVAGDEPDEPDDELNRLWIRAIDVARKYDILGLDRVPIDEELRGEDHEHTWDHRVAWKTGPGARICTICGKIRRRTDEPVATDAAGESE